LEKMDCMETSWSYVVRGTSGPSLGVAPAGGASDHRREVLAARLDLSEINEARS